MMGLVVQKKMNFITAAEVISDMGIQPASELASEADRLMADWYVREIGHQPEKYNGSYYYLEYCFRKKIEGLVRVVMLARDVGLPLLER
jgi:hypothetical protein